MVHAARLPRQPDASQNQPTPDTRPDGDVVVRGRTAAHHGPPPEDAPVRPLQTCPDPAGHHHPAAASTPPCSPAGQTIVFVDCGPWFGGAQRSLLTLACGLLDAGYTPVLLAADTTDGGLSEQARCCGIATHTLPVRHWRRSLRGMAHFVLDRRRCLPLIREVVQHSDASLVHANGLRPALLACPATPHGTPVVVHARDVREPSLLRRWTASHASAVIAISRTVASRWHGAGTANCRLETIHNGLDLHELERIKPAEDFPWDEQHVKATIVADMVRWKRHDLFLASIHEAHARDPRIRGVVVGRPLNRRGEEWLLFLRERTAALGLSGIVAFVTDAQSALPWIAASDVLVSTADTEPFGRTIVEALALGRPVVTVRGGGPEEILAGSGAGVVVDPSPVCLAAAILELADPESRHHAESAARRRARDFTARQMVERTQRLYESLLHVPPPSAPNE